MMSDEGVRPTIVVVGIGGAGCNTVQRLHEVGTGYARTIAIHTEANHLTNIKALNKLLVGESVCKGFGTGGNPIVGEKAVQEDLDKIINTIGRPNVLIVTGGLGGGTASGGMTPILEEMDSKSPDTVRLALVTFPFSWEGAGKINNARYALTRILRAADLTIVNLNDLLLKRIGTIQVDYAFKYMDALLVNTIKSLTSIFTLPHHVSISFADFVAIARNAGLGAVGHGMGGRVGDATKTALRNTLLDAEIKEADSAIAYLQVGKGASLEEAGEATRILTEEYGLEKVYWGLRMDPAYDRPRVMVMASGVRSPTLEGLIGGSF